MENPDRLQFVRVALDVPLARLFDYAIEYVTKEDIGRRVVVPFANRLVLGVIVAKVEQPEFALDKIKKVHQVLIDVPALSKELFALFTFCSEYYHHPLGQVIFTALPARLRQVKPFQTKVLRYFQAKEDFRDTLSPRAVSQHQLASHLLNPVSEVTLKSLVKGAGRHIARWFEQGLIEEVAPPLEKIPAVSQPMVSLHPEQQEAVEKIHAAQHFQAFLLYGVTGSGKTEVYLEAIAHRLEQGLQVLMLIPEINLTPQLEARFKARFATARIVSLHSHVSDTKRADIWLAAERGEIDIILGTRLSVFTPLPRLGLIVVDEEHDSSFKQQEGLRYHARDVAVFRAKLRDIPIVMGSATPALESWYNAQKKRYQLLTLTKRAAAFAQLPKIQLIHTEKAPLLDGLHPQVIEEIDQALARHEQVLVFLNRRGYSPVLYCNQCGWSAVCKRCSSRLTVHLRSGLLKCHLCGHEALLYRACLSCGNTDIKTIGHGTQRLEEALKNHFSNAEVIRVDRDSMSRKESWSETFERVKTGRGQILVGTQMLAKGHDFPNLSLAIILNTDAALHSADFRAEERLFAQLMQVAGRVGRANIPGKVLLQTQQVTHPLYLALQQYDYAPFANRLLEDRRIAHFPPHCFQAILRAEAHDIKVVLDFLYEAKALAPPTVDTVYDPVTALVQKMAGKERAQLLIQDRSRQRLQQFVTEWLSILEARKWKKVRWFIEIDPMEV